MKFDLNTIVPKGYEAIDYRSPKTDDLYIDEMQEVKKAGHFPFTLKPYSMTEMRGFYAQDCVV